MNLVISSTTANYQQYWPQNQQIIDEKKSSNNNNSSSSTLMMSSSSPTILMEKSNQQQEQELHQQQSSLKCPRCDSSNTKFCYYNNYSLSQPRHFCKACKRYWTRGGTLRNVPVGGGCRKNKRLNNKRPTPSSISTLDDNNSPNSSSSNPNPNPIINSPPLFYGLPTTTTTTADPTHLNLPYQNFNSRVSVSGYGGLGFSSGLMNYSGPGGFNPKEIQEVVNSSTSLLSRYPIFGSTNLQQHQKFMGGLVPYEDMQIMGGIGNTSTKQVKMEDSQNRLNWNSLSNQMDQIGSSDPSLLWLDPSNIGSSVPSLI